MFDYGKFNILEKNYSYSLKKCFEIYDFSKYNVISLYQAYI